MAVKESGEREVREYEWKSQGIYDEKSWNQWFYSTTIDRIDCANVAYLREKMRGSMYLISGGTRNVATIILTDLATAFAVSFGYEWWRAFDAWMSYGALLIMSILAGSLWILQIRDADSRLPLREKSHNVCQNSKPSIQQTNIGM